MENRIKLLFVKLTILSGFLALVLAVYYFSMEYPLSKSFQLGILVALGALVGAGVTFFLLSLLLIPLFSRIGNKKNETNEILSGQDKPYVVPREERIIRHSTKEEYIEHSINKEM
ncbi:MAG: hypothetical protein U9R26_09025, partial [Campylobacterota bacterium]|nr:hypothetical protein [Campylobacterota bacterium]